MKKALWRRGLLIVLLLALEATCLAQSNLMVTTVVSFNGTNGSNPAGSLISGADGLLYGTTIAGGQFNQGIIFKTTLDGASTNLWSFDGTNGGFPWVLVQTADGSFYGTANVGGNGYTGVSGTGQGTLFRLCSNDVVSNVFSFSGTNGAVPFGLIEGQDKNLYGVTFCGGAFTNVVDYGLVGYGTVFKLATNGDFTLLASFNGTNGQFPRSLLQGADGSLYGTTDRGGTNNLGTIFKVTTNGALTSLFSFADTNGANPDQIMQASDGLIYGVTFNGGSGDGTIFRISTNGDFSSLFSFAGGNGRWPRGKLWEGTNGSIYGITYLGGTEDFGTMFQVTTNGNFSTVIAFYASGIALPLGGLTKAADGNYYGVSQYFGDMGLLYSIRPIEVPAVTSSVQNQQISLDWLGFGGCQYLVQYKNALDDPTWYLMTVKKRVGSGAMSFSDTINPGTQKFYKVSLELPSYQ